MGGIWNAADKTQSTACGGSNSQVPAAPTAPTGVTPDQVIGPGGVMNGGLACSKMVSGTGTTVSNTATFGTVQPTVSQSGSGTNVGLNPSAAGTAAATACPTQSGALAVPNCVGTASAPYTVSLGTVGSGVPQAANLAQNGGLVTAALLKATRGIPQSGTTPATTATPTACIGPDVFFNNVLNTGLALGVPSAAAVTTQQAVALCDPNGCIPGQDCQGAPAGGGAGVAHKAVGATTANG